MKHTSKQISLLKKSIKEDGTLTIYTGIYTINKQEIIKQTIEEVKKEKEVVVLDFSIMNLNRKYEGSENIQYLKEQVKPNNETVIFILEFTNCENWNKLIDFIINNYKNAKIFCSTSCNFSSVISFSKMSSFKYVYNEIKYEPPTMTEYFEECLNSSYDNYIENGSLIYKDEISFEKLSLISEINLCRLFNIFFVLTKVRNHFYIEIFFKFLLENLDKKLTIDFIKKNISKSTKLKIRNSKIFWKYINLLLDLYILIPVNTISTNSKSIRIQSKFICVDHMLFNQIPNAKNKYFLIGRNIFISEFIKKKLDILTIENNGEEIGIAGKLVNGKKIIFSYSQSNDDLIIKTIIGQQTDEYELINFKKSITKKELITILDTTIKNIE
ncbi:ATP-binding protein [Malacoplasma penetrans]|uniref:AAA family ATPase n=1 Tax=Malacoplasma penetrans TaxID=28227 RepID=UPI001012E25C|nr:AAA family ATPase [Malacoplasma penetrans]RXY97003.1 ATP-binding protein [Malacoplasma penetrans]